MKALRAICGLLLAASSLTAFGQAPFADKFDGSTLNERYTVKFIGDDDVNSAKATVAGGELTVESGGYDIWDNQDDFTYIYITAKGDFEATLKVLAPGETDGWAKSGLMIRANDTAGSPQTILAGSFSYNLNYQWRTAQDGASTWDGTAGTMDSGYPITVKMVREGTKITGFKSYDDGATWDPEVGVNSVMTNPGLAGAEVLVGIAFTSHSAGNIGTAVFDDFTFKSLNPDPTDNTPPGAVTGLAATSTKPGELTVTFTPPAGEAIKRYSIHYSTNAITDANVATTPAIQVAAAGTGQQTATITGLGSLLIYNVAVRAEDMNGNVGPIATASAGTSAAPLRDEFKNPPATGVTREVYLNIGGGVAITDLTSNAKFPDNPDRIEYMEDFHAPVNEADNYGQRTRALITAPATGKYTFGIAGDDYVELWLSTDATPANARRIAYHNDWTDDMVWDKIATQTSEEISLESGKQYYIEALMKEGGGGDNLAVRWVLPDGTEEAPIGGDRLKPYVPTGATGRVLGAVTAGGKPVPGASIIILSGGDRATTSTDASGNYTTTIGGGDATITVTHPYFADVKQEVKTPLASSQVNTVNINMTTAPVEIGRMSLRDDDLKTANLPGWSLLTTTPDDYAAFAGNGDQNAPDTDALEKWLTVTRITGESTLIPGINWLENWDLVPGDAGPRGDAGTAGGIPDNTYWVEALKFQLANDLKAGKRFILGGFNADDYLELVGMNGTRIAGEPIGQWNRNWNIEVPAAAMKTDAENLLLMVGYEGDGGAGHNTDYGGPFLIAYGDPGTSVGGMPGDLNGDGKINVQDATLSLRIAVGLLTPTDAQKAAGDVNKDGKLNIQDTTLILQVAVGNKPASELK